MLDPITILRLHAAVEAVCPIIGVGQNAPPAVGYRIDFKAEATEQQKLDAVEVLNNFDFSESLNEPWLESRLTDRKELLDDADVAIEANQTFLALPSPNNAQTLAQVKRLTQQNIRIIKVLKLVLKVIR